MPNQTLLLDLLRATSQNQEVYPILQQNLDKLNDGFALLLRQWISNQFAREPAKAINIARIVIKFSTLIQQFEQGNASHLEIAIAGYEAVLQVVTREAFPQDWSSIQQALVAAYQQRQQILSRTIAEFRHNTVQTQTQINTLTEQFQQELQQVRQQVDDLKTAITQLTQETGKSDSTQQLASLMTEFRELKQRQSLLEQLTTNVNVSPTRNQFNTAIFYDIENLTMGRANPNLQNFCLKKIKQNIEQNSQVNKIAIQCAYADWSDAQLRPLRQKLQELGIETVQIFDHAHKKNAADIQLTIDAVELAHSRPSLQVFVIVSGDGAFASLAKKLHEHAKTVIGCAYRNQTNRMLAAVCDHFIWIPNPQVESRDETIHLVRPTATAEPEARITDSQKVLDYLKTNEPYCSRLTQDGVDLPDVKQIFTQLIPGFDYRQQGFTQFRNYLDSVCQGTEFEIVFHDENRTRIMLKIRQTSVQTVMPHVAFG